MKSAEKGAVKDDQVGYDAGKKVKGRKIHALVDTEGLPMRVVVHSAGDPGSRRRRVSCSTKSATASPGWNWSGPMPATTPGRSTLPWPRCPSLRMEIVKRSDDMKGFVVLPRRWVVERTFSWFGRNRRLAKDFENLADTLAAFVTLASIQLALRRLARA